ncbi:MAG TPA: hypothetical protein VLT87_11060 [Thermoanaerobaculia bacterium]|nr:hypothetical protein [Thermoanaerobaculia bacterium]
MRRPILAIAWSCFWLVPFQVVRGLLCGIALIGWGSKIASQVWEDTK